MSVRKTKQLKQASEPQFSTQPTTESAWSEFEQWGGRSWFAPCTCLICKEACAVHGRIGHEHIHLEHE